MTDPYINDSSDNESKNGGSCTTKSKLESAEALLADLNLLNSASAANATNSVNNGPTGTTNGTNGLNGTSTGNNSTSTNTNNSNGNANNNNLVLVLLKEISKLHETNKKICRNLHETKGRLKLAFNYSIRMCVTDCKVEHICLLRSVRDFCTCVSACALLFCIFMFQHHSSTRALLIFMIFSLLLFSSEICLGLISECS